MHWFAVIFEHIATGIRFTEYVQAVFPTEAREYNPNPDWMAVEVRVWGPNTRWPKLPNYVGPNYVGR